MLFDGRRASGVRLRGRDLPLAPRRRGHPLRRRDQLAAASAAVRHRSGRATCSALGIPVLHDAPEVGANLADHLDIICAGRADRGARRSASRPAFLPRAMRAAWAYLRRGGKGELTSNVAEAGGFVRSDPARDRPNLQFHFIPAYLHDHGRRLSLGLWPDAACLRPSAEKPRPDQPGQPRPHAPPRIAGELPVATPTTCRRPAARPEDRPPHHRSPCPCPPHPAARPCPARHVQSDAELDRRHPRAGPRRSITRSAPAAWARMPRAVVDPAGRVRGVSGLRVVDASIMPADHRGQHQRADHDDRREHRPDDAGRRLRAEAAPPPHCHPVFTKLISKRHATGLEPR